MYDGSCQHALFAYKFTGKERDPDIGVDYFGARFYQDAMARFYSPDDGSDQDPSNPQSWNLYSYVRNNPVSLADEDGHAVTVCEANGQCSTLSNDAYAQAQQGDTNNLAPSLADLQAQYGATGSATGSITDPSGNAVGTVQYVPDNPALEGPANLAGARQLAGIGAGIDNLIERVANHPAVQGFLSILLFGVGGEGEGALEGVSGLEIQASDGTVITGFTEHGLDRAVGEGASGMAGTRAGTKPDAILDALKNPKSIKGGIDSQGRPYKVFTGQNARVVVNPQTGLIVSVNPTSGAGAH
jgi:RHS repeat-associated protein